VYSTEELLDNVVWLVNALDDAALAEVQDIPFLEMARWSPSPPCQPVSCLLPELLKNACTQGSQGILEQCELGSG
jgi:hypothetical protein